MAVVRASAVVVEVVEGLRTFFGPDFAESTSRTCLTDDVDVDVKMFDRHRYDRRHGGTSAGGGIIMWRKTGELRAA